MNAPRLTVVIPCFNEERTVGKILRRVHAAVPFAEVICVDDGSTDGSLAIMKRFARPSDQVISKDNGGKGSAVRRGIAAARGAYIVTQDADLEYDPNDLDAMLQLAEHQHLPAVIGSRRIMKQHQYAHIKFYIGGTILTWIHNLLFGTHLSDQPNCYKMVRRDILQSLTLTENDFRLDCEITALLAHRGVPMVEIPTSYRPRSVAEGKKIGWIDWFRALGVMVRVRLATRKELGARI